MIAPGEYPVAAAAETRPLAYSRHARGADPGAARRPVRDRSRGRHEPARPGRRRAACLRHGRRLDGGWRASHVSVDPAGNLYGRLPGSDPTLAEVWSGSHLDTPPDGGRFDGALGVLVAVDALEAIGGDRAARRARWRPSPSGWRRARGSAAAASAAGRCAACWRTTRPTCAIAEGVTLGEAFAALGLGELPEAGWLDPPPACWVETHIEQGPTLAGGRPPAGRRHLDRRDGRRRDRVRRTARPRRDDADGAARRRAGRRGGVRGRRARRRPVDPRARSARSAG